MNKDELILTAKPILFNTEMVRAILDGEKTVTRRVCKIRINGGEKVAYRFCKTCDYPQKNIEGLCANFFDENNFYKGCARPYYQKGDILYVRETWKHAILDPVSGGRAPSDTYLYKADEPIDTTGMLAEERWRPSIHMPKEAARIFLQVTDVKIERLQDIDYEGCKAEGIWDDYKTYGKKHHKVLAEAAYPMVFAELWDSTINPKSRDMYGWEANPWVWVIRFEKIEVD